LDNDGVEDLVIAYFDGQHSAEGSGYIFLSNGTGGIVNGRKVLLPPGLFGLQTTKHNFMTICDLNRDGLKDIVIAQTRTNPYYGGRTLQVLMNKGNGQFVDETGQRIHGNNDRHDDQSFLSGEGVLYCQDLNGDGYLDLFDSLLGPLHNNFNRAFLNNGRGVLHAMPSSIIPIVHPYHMQGREHFKGEPYGTSNYYRLIPIDLNGDGRVSFLAVHNHTPDYWPLLPGDAVEATYYIIRNIKPYTLPSPFVASVLPSSRSVEVGVPATAFATIINTGSSTATDCGIAPITGVPANFVYQATNPATNQIIGAPNTSVTIAPGAAQSFVFAFTPTTPMASTDVQFRFDCADSSLAPINPGLNTLLFSVSSTPVPDIVALAATPANDGIVNVLGANGAGAFAVATVNVGASGNITASADTGSATLPVNISLCQTDPATGLCVSAIGSTVTTTINANGTPTFGIFFQGNGNVHFDPAFNRVRFTDASGVTRGSTSVAIRTQ
jgi:hypothetical protein